MQIGPHVILPMGGSDGLYRVCKMNVNIIYTFSFANLSSLNVEILIEPIPTGCLYYCGIILGSSMYRP